MAEIVITDIDAVEIDGELCWCAPSIITEIERLRAALTAVTDAYQLERDSVYECAVHPDGSYGDPDDKRIVEEMDAILNQARAVLERKPEGE